MAEELTRKKGGMGSGNMSTPATTSSNASSSGYGYAPLYEALAQSLSYADSASVMAAAAMDSGTSQTASTRAGVGTGVTDDQLARLDSMTAAQLESEGTSIMTPATLLGVDVEKAGLGAGVSLLTNLLAPTPMGILGLAASTLAKKALETARISNQDQMMPEIQARWGQLMRPVDEEGTPVVSEPTDAITAITEKAINPPASTARVAEDDDDPLGTWIRENIPDSTSETSETSTPSQGPDTGVGSGFNSAGWGNYSGGGGGDRGGSDSSSSGDS